MKKLFWRLAFRLGLPRLFRRLNAGKVAVLMYHGIVPDDAAVLVIADPTALIPPEQIAAVRTYLNTPRKNGKKGKLVVIR